MLYKREYEILKTLSYAGAMNVLFIITSGTSKFSDIMFEARLNPGILNRLLKLLISANMIERTEDGYKLSRKGARIISHAIEILAIEDEIDDYEDIKKILSEKKFQKVKA
jgi:predicted transcriptional regulator